MTEQEGRGKGKRLDKGGIERRRVDADGEDEAKNRVSRNEQLSHTINLPN